jgi:hypothetical protein
MAANAKAGAAESADARLAGLARLTKARAASVSQRVIVEAEPVAAALA